MPSILNQTNKNLWGSSLLYKLNTQNYPNVINLLDAFAELQLKWSTAESELKKIKEKIRLYELKSVTTSTLENKLQRDIQLDTAREQITVLIKKNAEMKTENSKLKRMINSIQKGTVTAIDNFMSSNSRKRSAGSEFSTDFDASADTYSLQPKRPSIVADDSIILSSQNAPEKVEEKVYVEESAGPSYVDEPGTPKLLAVRRSRRSMSVPVLNISRDDLEKSPMHTIPEATRATSQTDLATIDMRKLPLPTTPSSGRTPFSACIEYREHTLHQKRAFARVPCGVCNGVIRFGTESYRCKNCKVVIHVECRGDVPKPCIPYKPPCKDKTGRLRIVDYCPDVRPRLPFVVLHCVRFVDSDLHKPGLYTSNPGRVLGDDVLTVLLQEQRTSMEPLKGYDSRAVAQCLLSFLQIVRDSVIPEVSHEEFFCAVNSENADDLEVSITDLPAAHKNTLAYLFLHWQRVLNNTARNFVDPDKFIEVIGSAVLRGSDQIENVNKTIRRLLAIDKSIYESILEDDVHSGTPLSRNPSKNSATRGDFFQRTAAMSQVTQRKESLKKN